MLGEKVIMTTRIHSGVLIIFKVGLITGAMIAITGAVLGDRNLLMVPMFFVGGIIILWSLIFGFVEWMEKSTTEFVCTDKRILIKSGYFTTHLQEMPNTKIVVASIQQTMMGKMLGFASLTFALSGGAALVCNDIDQPHEFYKTVRDCLNIA